MNPFVLDDFPQDQVETPYAMMLKPEEGPPVDEDAALIDQLIAAQAQANQMSLAYQRKNEELNRSMRQAHEWAFRGI